MLTWGEHSGLSRQAQCHHMNSSKQRKAERIRDTMTEMRQERLEK